MIDFYLGPSRGNRTPIHGLEDHCPIRWTIDRNYLVYFTMHQHCVITTLVYGAWGGT